MHDIRILISGQKSRRSRRSRPLALLASAALIGSALATTASAPAFGATPKNTVLEWNLHAATALISASTATTPGAGQTPPVSGLHLAMVQGAVYDAVNSIHRGFKPYLRGLPRAPASASKAAAAATAAHHVLVGLTPALPDATKGWLDDRYAESMEAIDAGPATDQQIARGIETGAAAAQKMLEVRADDGRYSSFSFTEGTQPGEWRRTTPDAPTDPFAWVAKVKPFTLTSQSQFRSAGPLALGSAEYAQEYNEVKSLGGNGTTTPTTRTSEQTALATFYTSNPVEMFNRAFRTIAEDRGLSIVEQARLFARLNLTGADSFINCWDDKAYWNFWRPITAIRLGDTDGNDATAADPTWTSMVPAPAYPDHPSGYNCITGGLMYAAKRFFKTDEVAFNLVRIAPNTADVTRSYQRFTDVTRDTIDARIFLGIHFRTPDVQAVGIGRDVARWVDRHYFQKINN